MNQVTRSYMLLSAPLRSSLVVSIPVFHSHVLIVSLVPGWLWLLSIVLFLLGWRYIVLGWALSLVTVFLLLVVLIVVWGCWSVVLIILIFQGLSLVLFPVRSALFLLLLISVPVVTLFRCTSG